MAGNILKRARAFIGLEEVEEDGREIGEQLDMTTVLKSKREYKGEPGYAIMCYEPKVYEDSLNISTHLRAGSPVIINLKHLDPAEGTRLVDFICGTAYAIDGHMMKIGETIFLFAPSNITVVSSEEKISFGNEIAPAEEKKEGFFSRG